MGRELVEDVTEWAITQGCQAIQFDAVVQTDVAAVRLCISERFRVVGTAPGPSGIQTWARSTCS